MYITFDYCILNTTNNEKYDIKYLNYIFFVNIIFCLLFLNIKKYVLITFLQLCFVVLNPSSNISRLEQAMLE